MTCSNRQSEFSVLLSLYYKENAEYLKQSLNSIFNQTVRPSEVVLVIDGPITPELKSIVDEYCSIYKELKIVPLKNNTGLGNALNEGLKYCSYDIVARMDTDDIANLNRFEKQLEVFEKYPQVEVISCWIDEFEGSPLNIISTRKLPEYSYQIYQYAKKRCPINHPSVIFKKNSIIFAGGYQPFPLFEDYYLWVRLLLNGVKFYNIQESLLNFRVSPDMYKRRGGWKHAINEVKFQNLICRLGFISRYQFFINVIIRFSTRIVPNRIRQIIYHKFLRK